MTSTLPYLNPSTYEQWAVDFEDYTGLPQTPQETAILSAWEQAENPASQVGGYTAKGGYNALNTSLSKGASGLEPGSSFIPVYPDIQTGLAATWDTLSQANYAPELDALEKQSPSGLVSALGSAGHVWGTSPSLVASILKTGASTAGGSTAGAAGATASANLTGTGSTAPTVDLASASSANAGVRILASLDALMNASSGGFLGFGNALNPVDTAKVVIARGGAVVLGLMFLVAGGVVLVKNLLDSGTANRITSAVPGGAAISRLPAVAALA